MNMKLEFECCTKMKTSLSHIKTLFWCVLVVMLFAVQPGVNGHRFRKGEPQSSDAISKLELRMPGVRPKIDDDYICYAHKINSTRELYIKSFSVKADAQRAHHMLLYGCPSVDRSHLQEGAWDCGHHGICPDSRILFAWAKNAPETTLPPNVAFRIGGATQIQYIVMQVHYAHPLSPQDEDDRSGVDLLYSFTPQKYMAGIFLLMTSRTVIPPGVSKTYGEANCLANQPAPIHPFAFRVHAHKLGVVITGYRYDYKNDTMEEIARGNPQWPQAFYPMKKVFTVDTGDVLLARCTFNSTTMKEYTRIGSTANDEMCNLYIMYYTDAKTGSSFAQCMDEQIPSFHVRLPPDSDQPLPPNPLLEGHALHGKHGSMTHGMKEHGVATSNISLEHLDYNGLFAVTKQGVSSKKADPSFRNKKKPLLVNEDAYDTYGNEEEAPNYPDGLAPNPEVDAPKAAYETLTRDISDAGFREVTNWLKPDALKLIGQPSAVALDSTNNIVILHRSSRAWTSSTFGSNNKLALDEGPIPEPALITVSPLGTLVRKAGENMYTRLAKPPLRPLFYLPHGLTIDHEDKVWVTDVALHQIFKFKKMSDGPLEVELTLGSPMNPGNGDNLFCKPTSVAVLQSGEFYVADGYCNSRVVKYSPLGKKISEWSKHPTYAFGFKVTPPNLAFDIPHALALAEEKDTWCVADRENSRIQCFSVSTGKFKYQIDSRTISGLPAVYGVAYTPANGGELFAVTWSQESSVPSLGLVFNISNGQLQTFFKPAPSEFGRPHEMTISKDGNHVFVTDIEHNRVWYLKKGISTLNSIGVESNPSRTTPKSITSGVLPLEVKTASEKPPTSSSWSTSELCFSLVGFPFLLVLLIVAVLKLRKRSGLRCCRKMSAPQMKSFMGAHKSHNGFEKLAMDDSESGNSDPDESETEIVEYKAHGLKA